MADMEVDKVADIEANKVADMVAAMEVDKKANKVADIEVDHVTDMVADSCRPKNPFSTINLRQYDDAWFGIWLPRWSIFGPTNPEVL